MKGVQKETAKKGVGRFRRLKGVKTGRREKAIFRSGTVCERWGG